MSSNLNVSVNKETNEVTVTDNGFTFTIAMDGGFLPDVEVEGTDAGETVTLEAALEAAGTRYDYDLNYKVGNRFVGRDSQIESGSVIMILKEDDNG